jgi:transposase-like protein
LSRHRTPQEKLRIINEVRTGEQAVSYVCRKHGIAPARFYEWEKRFKEGGLPGLRRDLAKQTTARVDELEAEITRLKGVIAEIAEENLKIKKGQWP